MLKKYLPAIIDVEIEYMGRGLYLHEHSGNMQVRCLNICKADAILEVIGRI